MLAACKARPATPLNAARAIVAPLEPELIQQAEKLLVMEAQRSWDQEAVEQEFRTLNPVMWGDLWVCGTHQDGDAAGPQR